MSEDHITRYHNRSIRIGDYGLSQSMATESRYSTNRRQTVLEVDVEENLWAWHVRLEGYSG